MGNRGIRLSLDRKNLFKTQIRAIYRASWYGNLGMMYPMICSEEEMDEVEALVTEVKEELKAAGVPFKEIRTGIMMETPAAVMIGEELAKRVDFLGIGTNDLTQYTLAMDRQNPLLQKKYDDHHPAILKMIKMIVDAGHAQNCKVCLCGGTGGGYQIDGDIFADGGRCIVCGTGMYITSAEGTEGRFASQKCDLSLSSATVLRRACMCEELQNNYKNKTRAPDMQIQITGCMFENMGRNMNTKSKVIVLPCEAYDEERIYTLMKNGLSQLGGLDNLINKEEKNPFEA